jgi:hypothetical protein
MKRGINREIEREFRGLEREREREGGRERGGDVTVKKGYQKFEKMRFQKLRAHLPFICKLVIFYNNNSNNNYNFDFFFNTKLVK